MSPRRYHFDIEADGFLENATVVHSLCLKCDDTGEVLSYADQGGYKPISEGLDRLGAAGELIGHNIIGYDVPLLKKIFPSWHTSAKLTDTLILSRMFYPTIGDQDFNIRDECIRQGRPPPLPSKVLGTHKLEAWGYRLGLMKGDYQDVMREEALKNGLKTDDEIAEFTWGSWSKSMQDYCEQDVEVTYRLYRMFRDKKGAGSPTFGQWEQAVDLEHRFARLAQRQEQHGFRFDVERAEKLALEIRTRKLQAEQELLGLFDPWPVGLSTTVPKKTTKRWVKSDLGAHQRIVKKETGETYQHHFNNGRSQLRKVKVEVLETGYYEHTEQGAGYQKVELRVFNPGSRQQIENRLKKLYNWQPSDFTPSGQAKIDDDILGALPYPPAQALVEYFMLDKRLGQLSDGKNAWLKHERQGRIHGRLNTLGAGTGRCTHSNPNVAQVPSIENAKGPVPYGAECRSLFMADEGHVLIGADADGLELRCLAHFMQDGGRYAEIVHSGKKEDGTDIHTANQKAAGLPSRSNAKTFIYAFLYGAGDPKIGSIVAPAASPEEQAHIGRGLKKKFMDATPGLRALITAVKRAVKAKGWLRGIDGREIRCTAQHAALNYLLQNAGAVAMKLAPVLAVERLEAEGYVWGSDFAQVAHVHDEVQFSVHPDHADYVSEVLEWSITEAGSQLGFKCPLVGGAMVGDTWKDTH